LASADFQASAAQQNAEIFNFTREQTLRFIQDDAKAMQELVHSTGMKLQE